MKSWCLCIVFLIVTVSTSSSSYSDELNSPINIEQFPSNIPSSSYFIEQDRKIVKRSQRNANILYRYCRNSGQERQFCLKYAVQMIFATGH